MDRRISHEYVTGRVPVPGARITEAIGLDECIVEREDTPELTPPGPATHEGSFVREFARAIGVTVPDETIQGEENVPTD